MASVTQQKFCLTWAASGCILGLTEGLLVSLVPAVPPGSLCSPAAWLCRVSLSGMSWDRVPGAFIGCLGHALHCHLGGRREWDQSCRCRGVWWWAVGRAGASCCSCGGRVCDRLCGWGGQGLRSPPPAARPLWTWTRCGWDSREPRARSPGLGQSRGRLPTASLCLLQPNWHPSGEASH